ncbi:hypothetical protein FOXYSP1_08171 [Fusarium oxysporum f. sp. phaseoli]
MVAKKLVKQDVWCQVLGSYSHAEGTAPGLAVH